MQVIEQFTLKIRRGEGWFFGALNKLVKVFLRSNMPLPSFMRPVYRTVYNLHFAVKFGFRWLLNYFYCEPAFRSRCTTVGKNLHLWLMPDVTGHTQIHIGNNVNLYGHLGVGSGRIFDNPTLIIKDGCDIGHNVFITVNKEVIIEEEVNIASNVNIVDSDGHPRDPELRAKKFPPSPDEVKPVRICRRAWIGEGSRIMKGVTIGEGAIIGVNSVVLTDVPPYSVAIGNPARVMIKDIRTAAGAPQPAEATPQKVSV